MAVKLYYYESYGRIVQSDRPLPKLLPASPKLRPSLQLYKTANPDLKSAQTRKWARSLERAPSGLPWLTMQRFTHDGGFHIQFGDHIDFTVDGTGHHIWSTALAGDALATAASYLYGFVFGLTFYLQGATCLHASAVEVGNRALLFAGDVGYGKSSLAAVFLQRGFPLIADDLVVLDPADLSFHVPPAVPGIRLRADVANLVFGPGHELPRGIEDDKYYLDLSAQPAQFASAPRPLAAVFLLGGANSGVVDHGIRQLTPKEALLRLSRLAYLPNLMDKIMHRVQFTTLAALLRTIPAYQLPTVTDLARLPDLSQDILARLADVNSFSAGLLE